MNKWKVAAVLGLLIVTAAKGLGMVATSTNVAGTTSPMPVTPWFAGTTSPMPVTPWFAEGTTSPMPVTPWVVASTTSPMPVTPW